MTSLLVCCASHLHWKPLPSTLKVPLATMLTHARFCFRICHPSMLQGIRLFTYSSWLLPHTIIQALQHHICNVQLSTVSSPSAMLGLEQGVALYNLTMLGFKVCTIRHRDNWCFIALPLSSLQFSDCGLREVPSKELISSQSVGSVNSISECRFCEFYLRM